MKPDTALILVLLTCLAVVGAVAYLALTACPDPTLCN